MAQIDGAGQQDTDNQNAEALQAALAQRQVTLQGQPQGGSDVPSHENSDPVSDESEILRSRQPLTGKRRVPWMTYDELAEALGRSGEAVRALVIRKRWRRTLGNDGRARITVPAEALEARRPPSAPRAEVPAGVVLRAA